LKAYYMIALQNCISDVQLELR